MRRAFQVAVATVLVAGCPVAVVWWLRDSGTVTSTPLALGLGMALSLLASFVGQVVWEKQPGSEDLLFNELLVWGYVQRLRKQRRLASAASLVRADESAEAKREQRLLERLVSGMETRDPYLHGHSRRVARHAWMIAQRLKLPREEVARIRTAAALHDVGKTKTPKTILHKAGRLTDEEFRIIKLHPGEGAEMVSLLGDPELTGIIRHHHERLDGSGYPDGLAGEAIPLGARIVAVADTFDAITSARPYRAASAHKKAIDILRGEAGTRLDPDVVKAFCSNYAARGPVALWSFVCGLPERLVTWLSMSVGAVASAAKVVAVAAIVGGAATAGSTLGLTSSTANAGHGHGNASASVQVSATHASPGAAIGLRTASRAPTAKPAPSSRHGSHRAAAPHGGPVSTGAAPAAALQLNGAPAAKAPAGGGAGREESHGGTPESHGGGEEHHGSVEGTKGGTGKEAPVARKEEGKGKSEAPAPKHSEESPGVKLEEHGKPSEPPVHPVKEEHTPSPPSSGAGETSHGNGGEPPAHGKP